MKTLRRTPVYRLALALGLLALAAPAVAQESDSYGYGYVRVIEGSASVAQAGASERASAEVNQPVLAGDRISVPNRSRIEVVLADRNILRVDGGSELVLERLAASPDRNDRATVVRLLEGNLQLVVTQDSLGDELPRVETPNSSIYPQNYGVYRITADREGWSQLVVRRGTAEVVTDRDRATVRADEELVIDERSARGEDLAEAVREAGGYDSVERWARQLDDDSSGSDLRYVDDNLRYQAAPLARYGEWVDYEGAAYWRPRVEAGWRPYYNGRWVYLPSGLTWVSSEPWGWVPYHYGSWDYLPVYGWVWRPGYVWSPAWVYWYWGPDYVGWCPTGYYTRYYSARLGFDFGFRFGVYGYAGGDWSYFDHWNFVNTSYFDYRNGYRNGYRDGYWDGRRDVRRYAVPAGDFRNARKPLGRGIITTDTKPLRPSTWRNPDSVRHALQNGRGAVGELPDVTPFIARKPALPPNVQRTVQAENPAVLEGTPLRPGTLGKPARDTRGNRPGRDGVLGATPGQGTGRNPDRPSTGPVAKPGRPSIEVGGGAPNPRNSGNQGDRNGREPEIHGAQPDSQGGGRPVVRERPGRPAPEADGGAPRPERQPAVIEAKPNRNDDRPDRKPVVIEAKPNRDDHQNDRQQQPARQPERQPSNNDRPSSNDNGRARENDRNRDNGRPPANEDKPERKPPAQSQDLYRPQRPAAQPEGERNQPRYEPKPAPQVYRAPEPQRVQPAPQRPAEVKPAPQAQPQQPQRQEPQRTRGNDDGNGRHRGDDNDKKPPRG